MDVWFIGAFTFLFTSTITAFLYGVIKGKSKVKKSIESDSGLKCETSRETYKAVENIGSFLERRDWVCRLNVCYSDYVSIKGRFARVWLSPLYSGKWAYHGKDFNLCVLHRLCNYLGCEMIVRQVGSGRRREEEEFEQVQTFMREKLRRKGLSLIYPHNKKTEDLI